MGLSDSQKTYVSERWEAGDTAQVIANHLRKTRNCILGYVNREQAKGNLTKRLMPGIGNRVHISRPRPEKKPVQPKAAPEPKPEPPAILGPLNDFPKAADSSHGACQFTHDHPADGNWRMCGQPTKSAVYPWCEYHDREYIQNKKAGASTNGQISTELQSSQAQQSAA